MRLNIKVFENYSKQKGVAPRKMMKKLGGGKSAYKHLKDGCMLGNDLAKDMFNALGETAFLSLVDIDGGTIDGFKAKFIIIGNKLY